MVVCFKLFFGLVIVSTHPSDGAVRVVAGAEFVPLDAVAGQHPGELLPGGGRQPRLAPLAGDHNPPRVLQHRQPSAPQHTTVRAGSNTCKG